MIQLTSMSGKRHDGVWLFTGECDFKGGFSQPSWDHENGTTENSSAKMMLSLYLWSENVWHQYSMLYILHGSDGNGSDLAVT